MPEISDLTVLVRDVLQGDVDEGCAGGRYGRKLVSYSLRTRNIGPDDLILGNPGCPNCSLNPGATCTNPLFVCGTSHGHAHFEEFAQNEILDSEDNVVALGPKYGFCLLDTGCPTPQYSCSYQGITAGCGDIYSAGLPCQYVDITDLGLADGLYKIRVTLDPDNLFAEEDDANNVIEVPFTIGQTERVCPAFESTDVPKTIPDIGVATSSVSIPDVGEVSSLRLRMNGTHTYLGDIDAALTNPGATTRTAFPRMCGSADDFALYLGDDAVGPLVCPAVDDTVLRQPEENFTAFEGQEAAGNWTLTITDHEAGDAGTLNDWSLEICTPCGNGVVDPGENCDDGNPDAGDCCSPDCQIVAADGATCDDANACTLAETCTAGVCVPGGDVTCDPCLVCDSGAGCVVPDLIYPCQDAATGQSLITMRHDEADSSRDSVIWRWRSQTPVELDEFGAPDLVTDISLCVYEAGALVLSSTIPGGANCDNDEPCWDRNERNASFSDNEERFGGLSRIRIREGDRGRITLKGRGAGLGIDDLDLTLPATVRLRRGDGTPCWEANFDAAVRTTSTHFKARSR
ncbi:MAG: lysyl oxidase family protein [Candidatus Binatia bacterium]